jgi:hypothetical protein
VLPTSEKNSDSTSKKRNRTYSHGSYDGFNQNIENKPINLSNHLRRMSEEGKSLHDIDSIGLVIQAKNSSQKEDEKKISEFKVPKESSDPDQKNQKIEDVDLALEKSEKIEYDLKDLKFLEAIGEGQYGKVNKMLHMPTEKFVAIKVGNVSNLIF